MKKLLIALLMLGLVLCPAALADPEITVQGTGVIRTSPDIAVISLGAEAFGEDVALIQAEVNGKINAIIDALTDEGGIAGEDIQTGSYSIYRQYYDDYGNPTKNYVASCSLNVTVREVENAGSAIDLAFAAGANVLNNVSFRVEDDDGALADRALELAVADGIHRAQVIANAAGLALPAAPSRISQATDVYFYANNSRGVGMDEMPVAAETAAPSTRTMAGLVVISATVSMTYEIED